MASAGRRVNARSPLPSPDLGEERGTGTRACPLFQRNEIQIADNLFICAGHPDDCMIASNHSCDPNIAVQGQIVFVALREIAASEELTHDWATTDDAVYAMECRCGSAACRRIITGKDWQQKDLQRRHRGLFSWYLEQKIEFGDFGGGFS